MSIKSISNVNVIVHLAFLSALVISGNELAADNHAPPRCTDPGQLQSIYLNDWESGLSPWVAGAYGIGNPETFDTPDWEVAGNLPGARPGIAAFVPNLDIGDCASDDESGVLTLEGPELVLPMGDYTPRVSIDHWFQTEELWDGGNLKIRVNGGEYTLVPSVAFENAPYTDQLYEPLDEFGLLLNLNPIAGEFAFTGTPDGSGMGSWVQSQINLSGIANPGDTIQLRFDFGIDDCSGEIGWFVDDLEVYSCIDATSDLCGDSVVGGTEQCDDGNTDGGDGCSNVCDIEDGWTCDDSSPSMCTQIGSQTRLFLEKRVVNDNGGTATASDWTLTATGPTSFSGSGPVVESPEEFQAGTYVLSESGSPAGYIASSWVCSGGNHLDSRTIRIEADESVTCRITNDDFDSSTVINVGHNGAWYNPDTAGQGVLLDVDPLNQFMFIAWFTYTDDNMAFPFQQRWLTAQGNYSDNRAELTLYETLGGEFGDPTPVETLPIGTVTLVFGGCENAAMDYVIDTEGLQGSFPLTRVIPDSSGDCLDQAAQQIEAVDINSGMDGAWFDPNTSGQGFLIDARPDSQGDDFIFLAWFTFGDLNASGQWWLTAQGGFENETATMQVYETTGGSFNDPLPPQTVPVGDMTIEFEDCGNATLTYSIPEKVLEGSIEITRVIPGTDALCLEKAGLQ